MRADPLFMHTPGRRSRPAPPAAVHAHADSAPVVVAEIGVNHDGSAEAAYRLVAAAAAAGANAIKLQVFDPARLVTAGAATAGYQRRAGAGDDQRAMLERLVLPRETLAGLVIEARRLGLGVFATPFDPGSADLVDRLGVDAIKIGSGDVDNTALLRHVAGFGRPLVCSTGTADAAEVLALVDTVRAAAGPDLPLTLLHCVSAYPAPIEAANLRAIPALAEATGLPVGWSDHVPGTEAAVAAVALGARLFERHLTLDRTADGPDHAASDEPADLARYVDAIHRAHRALGDGRKRPMPTELDVRAAARRSLVALEPIRVGTIIEPSMLDVRRPGNGLPPSAIDRVVGRTARVDIAPDAHLDEEMLS